MTEANNHLLTPQLLYLSPQQNTEEIVLETIIKKFGETGKANINLINSEKGTFSIEMVRDLTQTMSYAALQGKTRHVILLAIDHATLEAQNALLKLLEEPPAKTQIWLTANNSTKLLPTIISRCEEIVSSSSEKHIIGEDISTFASQLSKLSHRELSDFAGNYSEREDAKKVIEQLIFYFHAELESSGNAQYQACIKLLLQTAQYLDANVTVRLALENNFFSLKKALSQ